MASHYRPADRPLAKIVILSLCLAIPPLAARAQGHPAPAVTVAPAEVSDLRPALVYSGRLAAVQKVAIRARIVGFLEAINFSDGQPVKQGDILYAIEEGEFKAVVQEIQGSLAAADANRKLAEVQRDRKAPLVKRGTVSRADFDIARANLGKAKGEVERLQGRLNRARLNLSYSRIKASFDGIAGLSTVGVGDFVGPETGALTTITRLDPMNVEFPVPAREVVRFREKRLRGGGKRISEAVAVSLTLPNGSVYPLKGKIDFVDAEVSQGTDTVKVRAVFENPDHLLLDGALVGVTLVQSEPQLVLSVPQRAIQRDQLGVFVMVVDASSKVGLRRVKVERTTNRRAVISEGLKKGELVITDGQNKVRPGITVDAAVASGS